MEARRAIRGPRGESHMQYERKLARSVSQVRLFDRISLDRCAEAAGGTIDFYTRRELPRKRSRDLSTPDRLPKRTRGIFTGYVYCETV